MKPLLVTLLSLGLIVALSACAIPQGGRLGGQGQDPYTSTTTTTTTSLTGSSGTTSSTVSAADPITRDRAIELALQAAELTRDEVFDLEAELDRERGQLYWEVDFETRDYEYSYDIHAETGAIAKVERERDF